MFEVRRLGLPQKVTSTWASEATSKWVRRANGSSRLTAIGWAVSPRAASSSVRRSSGGRIPMVPRPPASETAAASSCVASPPPMPAWTTGTCTPSRSRSTDTPGLSDAGKAENYAVLTIITEQGALCDTEFGTLPRIRRCIPLFPTTSTSTPWSAAISHSTSAGSPFRASLT